MGEDSGSSSDSGDPVMTLKEQLKNFDKIAATGQLFLKYTGKRRRKPQDRIVKVSFNNNYKPKQISWGSDSRHIDFSEILYIAWGHWTPVFEARKDQLKKELCFSVVGKQQILDVQAQSKEMAELWVKGLRKLIGHMMRSRINWPNKAWNLEICLVRQRIVAQQVMLRERSKHIIREQNHSCCCNKTCL